MFWDQKSVFLVDFMETGTTINLQVYFETLSKCAVVLKINDAGILRSGIVLRQDNVYLHMVAHTINTIQIFRRKIFKHPPYRTDLKPSEHNFFLTSRTGLLFNNSRKLKSTKLAHRDILL